MRVKIQRVEVGEEIKKPGQRTGYRVATVQYDADGAIRKQNIMSFVNPAVFRAVQDLQGETVDVTLTKNAKGYDEWAAVTAAADGGTSTTVASSATATGAAATRVTGSNFETPVERARRQVLIVRQSSLTSALKYIEIAGINVGSKQDVFGIAQDFVDFVFDDGEEENV